MECKCGGEVESASRMIKTAAKAREWSEMDEIKVPIILTHLTCNGCGREGRIIYSMNGEEVMRKGV